MKLFIILWEGNIFADYHIYGWLDKNGLKLNIKIRIIKIKWLFK